MITQGKYGKYVPAIQTVVDALLLNAVFVAMTVAFGYNVPPIRFTYILLIFEASVAPILPLFYVMHNRRMARAEMLAKWAVRYVFFQLIIFAALITFFDMGSYRFGYFASLMGLSTVALIAGWIGELLLLKRLRRHGRNTREVVIIGCSPEAVELSERLTLDDGYGIKIMGYFDDEKPGRDFKGNYLGTVADLKDYCANNKVRDIYYTLPTNDVETLRRVIGISDGNMCSLYIVPLMNSRLKHQFYMISLNDSIPAIGINPSPLRNPLNNVLKRSFDLLFSTVALVCSPIIFIPVAIAIYIDSPGPIFFRQKRTGYLGKEFTCYKFRTMRVNKDADSRQASKNDNRKTRVGDFLRRTSIDELPQFINVFLGDMSIVGPRPHMLAHTEMYRKLIDNYMVRHLVKPGVTGWAQISGFRGATDELWQMEGRVVHDVWYIEHWSFMLDLKIMLKTITNAISGEENAY